MQRQAEKDLENKKIDVDVVINGQLDDFISEFEKEITPVIKKLGGDIKNFRSHAEKSTKTMVDTANNIMRGMSAKKE